jgi:hypothetical protein
MRLDEGEKALLRAHFGCPPGGEMAAYMQLVQAVRPWLRPQIGWMRFGKLHTAELLEAYQTGRPPFSRPVPPHSASPQQQPDRKLSPTAFAEGEAWAQEFIGEIEQGDVDLAEVGLPPLPSSKSGVQAWVDTTIHALDLPRLRSHLFGTGYSENDFQAFVYGAGMAYTTWLERRVGQAQSSTDPTTYSPVGLEIQQRGDRWAIGHGADYYGVWDSRRPDFPPLRFPKTPDGWYEALAWLREREPGQW